jgi:organic radical activating enzyme
MTEIVTSDLINSKNTLYIEWEVTQKCNYRCSYCSAYDILGKNEISWNKKKYIIDELNKSNYKILLYLLGGEPTISKDYFKILEYIEKINKNNKFEVFVSTNFSQPKKFYEKHKNYKNTNHWLSLHPEYIDVEKIKEKTLLIKDKGFYFIFAPMIMPDEKYLDMYYELKDFALKNNLNYYPQIVVNDKKGHYWASDEEFYKKHINLFENSFLEVKINNKYIPYHLFFLDEKLQKRKNFNCFNSYFEIYWDGSLSARCLNINEKFLPLNFFKKFKIKKIKCSREFCDDYTLIHMYKYKTDEG